MTRADSTLGPATLELFQRLDAALEGNGALGVLYFLLTYVLATLLLAPASALVILSGALYGPALGAAAAIAGTLAGSAAAFLLARYSARPYVSRVISNYPRFAAVDRAVTAEGGRMVLLMRLSPFIPFNVANYIFGLTAVDLCPYLGFTLLGVLPYTFVFVYMGAAMRETFVATMMAGEGGDVAEAPAWQAPAKVSLYIVGVAATAMITLKISNAASRTLDEYALEDGDEDGSDADGSGGELHSDGGEVTAADSADAAERGERGAAPGDHL